MLDGHENWNGTFLQQVLPQLSLQRPPAQAQVKSAYESISQVHHPVDKEDRGEFGNVRL